MCVQMCEERERNVHSCDQAEIKKRQNQIVLGKINYEACIRYKTFSRDMLAAALNVLLFHKAMIHIMSYLTL